MLTDEICDFIKRTLEAECDITIRTSMEDVGEWDSFGHIVLMGAIENRYNIKLSFDEMMEMNSVANILEIIKQRQV